ncbi:hypothetical protein CIRMBP1218_02728 [Enterococcus cecorum]|nr:hypothetical protein CIRMBP1218_02728 [Enterococcus cecorum]
MTEVNFNTKIARQRGKHLSKEGADPLVPFESKNRRHP